MNADKMFEELGYKKRERESNCIEYSKLEDGEYIEFCMENKTMSKYFYLYGDKFATIITMPELKAINEKVLELGWLDNDEQHIPRID